MKLARNTTRWLALVCASALCGCGTPNEGGSYGINQSGALVTIPPKPNWDVSEKIDRLTDKPVTTIMNTAKNTKISGKSGFSASVLSISCGSSGRSASVYYDFPVGSNRASVVSYRFDSMPAQSPKADFLNTQIFFINGADANVFFQQLAQSTSLFVQVSSVTGVATSEFDTSGSEAVLAKLSQSCPLATVPPAAKRQKKQ